MTIPDLVEHSDDTSTTATARAHARAQAGTRTDAMPVVPAAAWPTPPEGVAAERLVWAETVPGGRYASKVLARGTRIRLRDLEGDACANVLLFRADAPWERLNVADTVKVPWQAYLGPGTRCSPMPAASSPPSSPTRPDTTTHCAAPPVPPRIGRDTATGPCTRRRPPGGSCSPSPQPSTTSPPGPAASLSFFPHPGRHRRGPRQYGYRRCRGVRRPAAPSAGDRVGRDTAHPLDPAPEFRTTSLELLAWTAAEELDVLRNDDPEYRRAVANTEDAWTALHGAAPLEGKDA